MKKYDYIASAQVEDKVFDNELGRQVTGLYSTTITMRGKDCPLLLEFTTIDGCSVKTTNFNVVSDV